MINYDRFKKLSNILESIDSKLDTYLQDENINYILLKNDETMGAAQTLMEITDLILSDITGADDAIISNADIDIIEEYKSYSIELFSELDALGYEDIENVSQDIIDIKMTSLLDKYDIMDNYKIFRKDNLDEQPIDITMDSEYLSESEQNDTKGGIILIATHKSTKKEIELDRFDDIEEYEDFKNLYDGLYGQAYDLSIKNEIHTQ